MGGRGRRELGGVGTWKGGGGGGGRGYPNLDLFPVAWLQLPSFSRPGDIVNSGIRLSYRPASPCSMADG